MAVLVDSAIIVSFLDRSDPLHPAALSRTSDIARETSLVASVVSFAEVIAGARLGQHDESRVRLFFSALVDDLVDVDVAIADDAARLRAANPAIRLPDALILATAARRGARSVLTSDRSWARLADFTVEVEIVSA